MERNATKIRDARKKAGHLQHEAAEALNQIADEGKVTAAYFSDWETAKRDISHKYKNGLERLYSIKF